MRNNSLIFSFACLISILFTTCSESEFKYLKLQKGNSRVDEGIVIFDERYKDDVYFYCYRNNKLKYATIIRDINNKTTKIKLNAKKIDIDTFKCFNPMISWNDSKNNLSYLSVKLKYFSYPKIIKTNKIKFQKVNCYQNLNSKFIDINIKYLYHEGIFILDTIYQINKNFPFLKQ